MADDALQRLLKEVRAARSALPVEHRELLDQLGVQETAITDWPDGVINLYVTLREPTPTVRNWAALRRRGSTACEPSPSTRTV
jgi:hypothetical protein